MYHFAFSTAKNLNSCCFISLLAFGISLLNFDCSVRYLMASYCLYLFFSKERECWISCRKIVFHMYLFFAFKVFCPLYYFVSYWILSLCIFLISVLYQVLQALSSFSTLNNPHSLVSVSHRSVSNFNEVHLMNCLL